jgi:hypothetical protein
METMIKRLIPIVLLIIVVIAGCGRKPDEELPARIGDLQVLFQIIDQANLPETFPVTVSLYSDSAHTLQAATRTVTVRKDSVNTVSFTDLPVSFLYCHIKVDVPSLSIRSRETDLTVYIKLHSVTVTPIVVLTVRPGNGELLVLYKIVDQADLPDTLPVTVSLYSDSARTLQIATRTYWTVLESVDTVGFSYLAAGLTYVHITVDVPSLTINSCETDLAVLVRVESITYTRVRVLTVYPDFVECNDL